MSSYNDYTLRRYGSFVKVNEDSRLHKIILASLSPFRYSRYLYTKGEVGNNDVGPLSFNCYVKDLQEGLEKQAQTPGIVMLSLAPLGGI